MAALTFPYIKYKFMTNSSWTFFGQTIKVFLHSQQYIISVTITTDLQRQLYARKTFHWYYLEVDETACLLAYYRAGIVDLPLH